jgi:hypothetical protein
VAPRAGKDYSYYEYGSYYQQYYFWDHVANPNNVGPQQQQQPPNVIWQLPPSNNEWDLTGTGIGKRPTWDQKVDWLPCGRSRCCTIAPLVDGCTCNYCKRDKNCCNPKVYPGEALYSINNPVLKGIVSRDFVVCFLVSFNRSDISTHQERVLLLLKVRFRIEYFDFPVWAW